MGMHFGLIAAKTSVENLRTAFLQSQDSLNLVASGKNFDTSEAVDAWLKSHARFVSARDSRPDYLGREVYAFRQHGPWAFVVDTSYILAGDEIELQKLSKKLGIVVSFVIETSAGCSDFWCFENGELRRAISYADGVTSLSGSPLPEEEGIDITRYYMAETESLIAAIGLPQLDQDLPVQGCQTICVEDPTDFESIHTGLPPSKPAHPTPTGKQAFRKPSALPPPAARKKPWWKVW